MKLAFFDKNTHLVDFQRHKLFADKHGFNILSKLNILSLFFCKDKINILISDCCQLTSLFKIYFLKINGRINNIHIFSLELFNLCYIALIDEIQVVLINIYKKNNIKYLIYLIFIVPIRITLLRLIIIRSSSSLFVPSKARISFLKKKINGNVNFFLLRNKPLKYNLSNLESPSLGIFNQNIIDIIHSGKFLFIAGRLNNKIDLLKIASFAKMESLVILVATNDKIILDDSISEFPNQIIDIGYLNNDLIMYISSKCLAGICLYNDKTINQRLSASSKLFEFLLINKPVIVSNNTGINDEINNAAKHLVITIDKLEHIVQLTQNFNTINEEFSFEYELDNLNF